MRFSKKSVGWDGYHYSGRKNGFTFRISKYEKGTFYVVATSVKTDIRYNSLWEGLSFETKDQAFEFCESFDYTKHQCLGNDKSLINI